VRVDQVRSNLVDDMTNNAERSPMGCSRERAPIALRSRWVGPKRVPKR
jgi:hypothetical protein